MIGNMLGLFARWILGISTRLFSLIVNNMLAMKVIFVTLFVVILPIIINNILYDLIEGVFTSIGTYTSAHSVALESVTFSDNLSYLINACGVIDCISILLAAMVMRFSLSWIPFVGPK